MKQITKSLYIFVVISSIIFNTSCSNEDIQTNTKYQFEDLKYIINVNNGLEDNFNLTRSASNKNDWRKGDVIIMAIDGDDNNSCILTYEGAGIWDVSKLSETVNFPHTQGKLSALHADRIDCSNNRIITGGDILYTKDGSYDKFDNVVVINLNMSLRPVSRIAVVGMDNTFWIDDLKELSRLNSLSTMQWDTNHSTYDRLNKEIYGDTCVFYGVLETTHNGETKISISGNDGVSYERIYPNTVNTGDYVILQGPLTNESDQWIKHTLVHNITLDKTELNLVAGDANDIIATVLNEDADNNELIWSSSNKNVATVDQSGNVKALSNGNATITVESKDGSASAKCVVHVRDLEEFINIEYRTITKLIGYVGSIDIGFVCTITNHYSQGIQLSNQINFTSSNTEVMNNISDFTATYSSNYINPGQNVDVNVNMSFSKAFRVIEVKDAYRQNSIIIRFKRNGEDIIHFKECVLTFNLSS